jgi:Flp pilus assembly protein TadB
MTTMLAALAGTGAAAGVWLIFSGLFGRPGPVVARPPSRLGEALTTWRHTGDRRRLAAATSAGLVVLVLTRWPAAAIAAAAAAVTLPRMLSTRSVTARITRLEALEQWVRKLASLLGASRGLEDALHTSVRHTPAAIAAEVDRLARRLRAGNDPAAALYRFAEEIDDPVGDLVAGALLQASAVRGRGVQALLSDLAQMVAADVAGRREVEAARAPHRTTVRGVALLFVLFGTALALRDDYSAAYDTPLGQLVLAAVLAVCGGGLWTMHRLATQPPVSRFLSEPATGLTGMPTEKGPGR